MARKLRLQELVTLGYRTVSPTLRHTGMHHIDTIHEQNVKLSDGSKSTLENLVVTQEK